MPGVSVGESRIEGLGVFAARPFSAGTVVLNIDTSRVVDGEHPLRPEVGEYEEHCTYLRDGRVALLKAPERHLNHSCDPNAYLRTLGTELQLVARRPIRPGQEVTLDYLINTHGGSRWRCYCGAEHCRGLLEESFFDLPLELQQEYLPLLEDWFVEQHAEAVAQLYRPIACGLHDRLEALATTGDVVRIVARAPDGACRAIEDRLVDVFARGGEEFVRTARGQLIRLDRLESVDGVSFGRSEEARHDLGSGRSVG